MNLAQAAKREWDVLVIGGGCTGAAVLRDLALRGFSALLVEQGDLVHGTSARFHGLLHSGARYAVGDPEAARECVEENAVLKRIARHCVEPTEGLFVRSSQDGAEFEARWLAACAAAGVITRPLTLAEARRLEPNLAPDIQAAYAVPDSGVDGFRLVWQQTHSAVRHGQGRVHFVTYAEVVGISHSQGRVTGVTLRDGMRGEQVFVPCAFVVSAAGSWAGRVAELAGLHIPVRPDRGTLVAFNHRVCDRVINRLRKSSDGDIFVPHGSITILGTTSAATDDPADTRPRSEEVRALLDIGRSLFPDIDQFRILRAFAGTRPLYAPPSSGDAKGEGRGVSRNFVVLDHETEGLHGFATVCGGKLTTCRLMAERVTDLVCARLGRPASCVTAGHPLVEEPSEALRARAVKVFPAQGLETALSRLGDDFETVVARMERAPWKKALLCECELVTVAEFEQVASQPTSRSLNDIRRRTRMGMGTCQGSFCGSRAVGTLIETGLHRGRCAAELLRDFQEERWHGFRPVLWGEELRETELARGIYGATLNIDGATCGTLSAGLTRLDNSGHVPRQTTSPAEPVAPSADPVPEAPAPSQAAALAAAGSKGEPEPQKAAKPAKKAGKAADPVPRPGRSGRKARSRA